MRFESCPLPSVQIQTRKLVDDFMPIFQISGQPWGRLEMHGNTLYQNLQHLEKFSLARDLESILSDLSLIHKTELEEFLHPPFFPRKYDCTRIKD